MSDAAAWGLLFAGVTGFLISAGYLTILIAHERARRRINHTIPPKPRAGPSWPGSPNTSRRTL